ncbi:uncharacterized protein K444DRAFT_620103 [Hyaloscypha bicolor E]|uniref:Uncharacterized protein n=1 Tax=Hyaloscypha bicolor E TaxID=1095630 RepID=A0A2J6SNU5_9HELO|nr:uncharacterized protein K444DRAFT_620103 [Hyaloscypha bicolor E]PMD52457.1 hypothetical protein K444DRAFT_620103 [Hyaloscypha bicolor E]
MSREGPGRKTLILKERGIDPFCQNNPYNPRTVLILPLSLALYLPSLVLKSLSYQESYTSQSQAYTSKVLNPKEYKSISQISPYSYGW